jgi:hypothetical protein
VERDREPEAEDLEDEQERQRVDEVDLVLKGRDAGMSVRLLSRVKHSPHDRRVRRQVEDEEHPDRRDARQRVQAAKQEVVSFDERL